MSKQITPFEIVAKAKLERSSKLNLSQAGLTDLIAQVPNLFEMDWLEELTLDGGWWEPHYRYFAFSSKGFGVQNTFDSLPDEFSQLSSLKTLILRADFPLIGNFSIHNLEILSRLVKLETLCICYTGLSDISFLSELYNLKYLCLRGNRISDFSLLKHLKKLEFLDACENKLIDLESLPILKKINTLLLGDNGIKDISKIKYFEKLTTIALVDNNIKDISPLRELVDLEQIYLRSNEIHDISVLDKLAKLKELLVFENKITKIAPALFDQHPRLVQIGLGGNPIINIPREIINNDWGGYEKLDFTTQLRCYLEDLGKGMTNNNRVKIIFIGNGGVGKTQIFRRLAAQEGFVFNSEHQSTDTINLETVHLDCDLLPEGLELDLWDFAGQDIYHATHRLFMQTKAIFLLIWDFESEKDPYHVWEGKNYKNEKLRYWLEYANCFGPGNPILLVQNKVDNEEDKEKKLLFELEQAFREQYSICDVIQVSAKEGTGFNLLKNCIVNALAENDVLREGILVNLPIPWVQIRTCLQNLRIDGKKELELATFHSLCADAQVANSSAAMLNFFHDAGNVYYQSNYFGNKILLDQDWAIQAIYRVLDRKNHYYEILEHYKGQLNYQRICKIWPEYSDDERKTFIDFMLNCELIFETSENKFSPFSERTYIVPQLLPDRRPKAIDFQLNRQPLLEETLLKPRFLPRVFIARFIVQAHLLAATKHIWQHGILLEKNGERILVEADYKQQIIRICYNGETKDFHDLIVRKLESIQNEGSLQFQFGSKGADWDQENEHFWDTLQSEKPLPISNQFSQIKEAIQNANYSTAITLLDSYFGSSTSPQYTTLKQTIEYYLMQGLMPPPAAVQGLEILISNLSKQGWL